MPVKSLNSSVLKWPNLNQVKQALHKWAENEIPIHPETVKLGYFGSYARGDWGVGSDLDLVAIVREAAEPFAKRPLVWHFESLPVPTEMVVYTVKEWQEMKARGGRFVTTLENEVVWIYSQGGAEFREP